MRSNPAQARFHEIDGLRALAVVLVLLHHSVPEPVLDVLRHHGWNQAADLIFAGGAAGVELFFVLSGVVLIRPYLRRERALNIANYFRRRIARLWPPYLVALVGAGLIVLMMTWVPTWYSKSLFPTFDLRDWLAQIGILNFGWPMYNGAWWSLTIEIMFYLLAPLIVLMLRPPQISRAVLISLVIVAVAFSELAVTPGLAGEKISGPMSAIRQFIIYLPCFMWGVLIAKFDTRPSVGRSLAIFGAVAVVISATLPVINIHAGFGTMFAGLVIAASDRDSIIGRCLTQPLAVWLGERSYSLFLVHFSVFYLVDWVLSLFIPDRSVPYGILSRLIGLPLAILAAMILFWTVERRFARNLATADRFTPWRMRRQTSFAEPRESSLVS